MPDYNYHPYDTLPKLPTFAIDSSDVKDGEPMPMHWWPTFTTACR